MKNINSFGAQTTLNIGNKEYRCYSLVRLQKVGLAIERLPYSLKILLENLLRHEDGMNVTKGDIEAFCRWDPYSSSEKEIAFTPARVILQDFTGVPALADLAAMRDAMAALNGNPQRINPLFPAELVIDHSVQVDAYGTKDALAQNAAKEFERNRERYLFLRWGQNAFKDFKVIPPATGIVHQVNIEYLARVVFQMREGKNNLLYPDTVVGTDSHTTMVNGLGVLGWGVGGIEAEAAMLGQAIPLLIPQVLGVKFTGQLPEGATATDLVLTVTEKLRAKGVVGQFVEFFGSGIAGLSVADRATLSNMAPEFGSTCAIFPIDDATIRYLKMTGRPRASVKLIEAYAKKQGLYWTPESKEAQYSDVLEIDLAAVKPCIAGPRRPQDRIVLDQAKARFAQDLVKLLPTAEPGALDKVVPVAGDFGSADLRHGSVVIAAITSCTNTSNPSVLMAAGLLAQKAVKLGLGSKPWVKTSLAPGSQVVTAYLRQAGLLKSLEALKFHVVGYGCTTCIGNSGPLPAAISQAIGENHLVACAVLSGNRNFEGRINPDVRANYLASPPLVVAYAIAGRMDWDPYAEPLGHDQKGNPVYLKDIWPTPEGISRLIHKTVKASLFKKIYEGVDKGPLAWRKLKGPMGDRYEWDGGSTYIQRPPFVSHMGKLPAPRGDIHDARVLAVLGDSVTTDHISPAGSIKKDSPAGQYLLTHGVTPEDFNSYGARRGNHEVMIRGTFANIRLQNALAGGKEGGYTQHLPDGKITTIYEASMQYQKDGVPLIILAGKEYGSGSSRDWAAKGPKLLGIVAVIAESFERIHRSNLVGMGMLPLQFPKGVTRASLGLTGYETYSIEGIAGPLKPGGALRVRAKADNGGIREFTAITRIDTPVELDYYCHGGIMPYVLRQLLSRLERSKIIA